MLCTGFKELRYSRESRQFDPTYFTPQPASDVICMD